MKKVTTEGYPIDEAAYKQTSVTGTFPKDGHILKTGQQIDLKFSYLLPDTSKKKLAVTDSA